MYRRLWAIALLILISLTGCMNATAPATRATPPQEVKDYVKEGGGGDAVSQQFAGAVSRLPETLQAYGLGLFPEINFAQLRDLTTDPGLHIELAQGEILVQGARKDARNFPEAKLIQIDAASITALLQQPDAEERLNALALHEVLGLLKIEFNDDYHISDRLLGNSKQSLVCSNQDVDAAATSASKPNVSLHARYDFLRLHQACVLHADKSPKACEFTAYPGWVAGGSNDVVESEPTDYFGLVADFVTLQRGSVKHTYFSRDEGRKADAQRLDFNVATLDIDWSSPTIGAGKIKIYRAVLNVKASAEKIAVTCKLNNPAY